jgi:release factor glutamine methyltransferase
VRRVLDLGTGSGCLLLAALTEFPVAFGIGVDLSAAALAIAGTNAAALGLAARVAFLRAAWGGALAGGFDLVLCNPPYIESDAIADLAPEVARFEPRAALDGGSDGLDAYRAVIADLPALLAPGGIAVLELGAGQASAVRTLAAARGLAIRAVADDLGGMPRALVLARGVAE